MKQLILSILLVVATAASAQTKLISFKSHSGNMAFFNSFLIAGAWDMDPHNLGMAPNPIIKTSSVDSIIKVNDTATVLVTSNYCHHRWDTSYQEIWKPGKDTVYNDPFWNSSNKDSMKEVLHHKFFFKNPVDCVKFIGYDVSKPAPFIDQDVDGQNDQEQMIPATDPEDPNGGMGMPLALVSVCMISIFIGLYSWRKQHFKSLSSEQYA